MVNITNIIQENLLVSENYLDLEKYATINIIGNRILQDLYSLNNQDLMVIGFILKEISLDIQVINSNTSTKTKEKKQKPRQPLISKHHSDLNVSITYAKESINLIKYKLDSANPSYEAMLSYLVFEEKIRKLLIPVEERDIYSNNSEFSSQATKTYLQYIISNKDSLLKRSSILIERSRSEIALLYNLYGGSDAILSYLFLRSFEYPLRYYIGGKIEDSLYNSFIERNIAYFGELVDLISNKNEEVLINKIIELIGSTMYEFRDLYGKLGDIPPDLSENIPLTPDVSERIRRVIEKNQGI